MNDDIDKLMSEMTAEEQAEANRRLLIDGEFFVRRRRDGTFLFVDPEEAEASGDDRYGLATIEQYDSCEACGAKPIIKETGLCDACNVGDIKK